MTIALSVVALFVSLAALGVAIFRAKSDLKTIRKAFRVLEADVEDQFERVESHLGRISRLKRTLGVTSTVDTGKTPESAVTELPMGARSRASLLHRLREKHGDFARKLRSGA